MGTINNKLKFNLDKLRAELEREYLPKGEEKELWAKICSENKNHERRKRVRIFTISVSVAASVALLCVWQWNKHQVLPETEIDYWAICQPVTPEELQSPNVQLLLSDNQKLDISHNESKIDYQADGKVKVNEDTVHIKKEGPQDLNQLIVPAGRRASLTLSDGTQMWVNSGSRVIFPMEFAENKREIFVEGEVFLNVSHKEQVPFIVKTKEIDVTVLGTQFNVSTLESKHTMEVVLVSGKVEVTTKAHVKNILQPNELYTYNTSTHQTSLEKVDVSDYIAWKDGYYQFNKQPMDKILQKIARYYGIQINWGQGIAKLTCSGKLDLKDNPDDIFILLKQAAPIEVEKVNGEFLVKVKP